MAELDRIHGDLRRIRAPQQGGTSDTSPQHEERDARCQPNDTTAGRNSTAPLSIAQRDPHHQEGGAKLSTPVLALCQLEQADRMRLLHVAGEATVLGSNEEPSLRGIAHVGRHRLGGRESDPDGGSRRSSLHPCSHLQAGFQCLCDPDHMSGLRSPSLEKAEHKQDSVLHLGRGDSHVGGVRGVPEL